jgi:hypothetical protein
VNSVLGRAGEVVKEEVYSILSKTPGYEQICETEEILSGNLAELPSKKSLSS